MERTNGSLLDQKVGGTAALYLAVAYLVAIPYFLLVLNYQSVVDPEAKLSLLVKHHGSLYAFNLLAYVVFGLALTVLALALFERLKGEVPFLARITAGLGIIWSCLLVASGAIYNVGMENVVKLSGKDATGAASAWQVIESVADGLGGKAGEALGGPWVLLVSWAGLQSKRLPKALSWLGLATGLIGLVSNVPPLRQSAVMFGLMQIAWLVWLGIVLFQRRTDVGKPAAARVLGSPDHITSR